MAVLTAPGARRHSVLPPETPDRSRRSHLRPHLPAGGPLREVRPRGRRLLATSALPSETTASSRAATISTGEPIADENTVDDLPAALAVRRSGRDQPDQSMEHVLSFRRRQQPCITAHTESPADPGASGRLLQALDTPTVDHIGRAGHERGVLGGEKSHNSPEIRRITGI